MAKGKRENMSDEEKEIDIESDEVNWFYIVMVQEVTQTLFLFEYV